MFFKKDPDLIYEQEKINKKYETKEPIKVIIGTCPGSRKDTEAVARAQVQRYFDIPERSWIYVQRSRGDGFYYEIHEGGSGYPYLPNFVDDLNKNNLKSYIKGTDGKINEVIFKPENKSLHSLILPESISQEMDIDKDLLITKQSTKRMHPYAVTGKEWLKTGVAIITIGLLSVSVSGVVHKSNDIAFSGYYEIAESMKSHRALQLIGIGADVKKPSLMIPPETLPIAQWQSYNSRSSLGIHEYIKKLEYSDGRWNVEIGAVHEMLDVDQNNDTQDPSNQFMNENSINTEIEYFSDASNDDVIIDPQPEQFSDQHQPLVFD